MTDVRSDFKGPLGEPARDAAPARLTERDVPPKLETAAASRSSSTCPACGKELQPEELGGTPAVASVPGKSEEREKPRRKKSWRIAVPDDAEDGKAVLDGLVDACREELQPAMGWSETVPPYHVLVAVMAAFLRGEKAQAA